ncbi:MAG: cytidine deaminase [Gammaproteobacteria bacterium GWF2_41_13]|nr:MAG: cytidine deaminase [Gammaproteobacteria bacterium GWF2_41_13]
MIISKPQPPMIELAYEMVQHAYAPYSGYRVGACVETEDGCLFGGCNVENLAFGSTMCAERNAIAAMIAAGKRTIRSMALVGSGDQLCFPCGACRQVMREFARPNVPIYLLDINKGHVQTAILDWLLPMPLEGFQKQKEQLTRTK